MEINESELFLTESFIDLKDIAAKGIYFLFHHFPYDIHTFQYIKKDPSGKSNTIVRCHKDKKKAFADAWEHNKALYDIYFMVNEGDGILHTGKRIPRSQQNVKELSQCFIDTDNCPIEKVNSYLEKIGLVPHVIIESSPGRFHLYFHLTPIEKSDETIQKWRAIQHILHRLGDASIRYPSKSLGTDGTMHDYSKILRVPGFSHVYKEFIVKIAEINEHPAFSLDELFLITSAQSYIDYNVTTYGNANPTHVPSLDDTSVIEAGERYAALQSFSLSLANTHTVDTAFPLFQKFVRTRLNNEDGTYLHTDGSLTPKSLALFDSAFSKIKREEKAIVEVAQAQLSRLEEKERSPWHLPDEFYLSAPNGFGDVVRQVMNYSMYPCAALAFGTFITGLSIVKAQSCFTPGGSSPALYTLNVAITGYGKNDPMTMLQNMFTSIGLQRFISNEIRSDRGIAEQLNNPRASAFFILDEVAPLLKAIQQDDANSYHANIAKSLLFFYSAGALIDVPLGKVAKSTSKKGEPEIVVNHPTLAVCGFTVPSEFHRLFNAESVSKGLFQRFIPIIPEIVDTPENPHADKHAVIKSDLFSAFVHPQELDKEGNPIAPLETVPKKKIRYTPDAGKVYTDLKRDYRSRMIKAALDPDTSEMSGLYTRLAEQIERIATTLSHDEIDLPTLSWAVQFMETRHTATMAVVGSTILRGAGSRGLEKEEILVSAVARVSQEQEFPIVAKRELYQRVRRHFTSMKDFENTLYEAEQVGKIQLVQNFKKKNTKNTKPTLGIALGDVTLE